MDTLEQLCSNGKKYKLFYFINEIIIHQPGTEIQLYYLEF